MSAEFGPRITELRIPGGPNLLAELGELAIEAGEMRYRLYGGHRLWVAPETPDITYRPDDRPPRLTLADHRIGVETDDGVIGKTMTLWFEGRRLAVEHRIVNRTLEPMTAAAWAITQLRPGGVARLVLDTLPADPHGLQPDRHLVLWPYASMKDPLLEVGDRAVTVLPDRTSATKLGTGGAAGAIDYTIDGVRLHKDVVFDPGARYPDRGANVQVYANDRFVELETLGPLCRLEPGASAAHTEWWTLTQGEGAGR